LSAAKKRITSEPYGQPDATPSRKYGGTGLGLNISREISRLLGGEIRVHSVPGEGSTFTLYLPLAYTPAPSAVVVPPPSLVPEGANGNLDLTRAAMPALASMQAK